MSHQSHPFYYSYNGQGKRAEFKRTTAPNTLAVALADAKTHLRVDGTDEDDYITALIKAATYSAEYYIEQSILSQGWTAYYDHFPHIIRLKYGPVTTIDSFTYYDSAGDQQTLVENTDFRVDLNSKIPRVYSISNDAWPSVDDDRKNGIAVTYTAGMATVPEDIQQGILMHVGHMYENRQEAVTGTMVSKVPMASEFLYAPYKVYDYA